MDHGLPQSYSSPIEPSSSSSSSNSNIPHSLAWLQDITISLCIDQESFRTVLPAFTLVGYSKPTLSIHSPRTRMQRFLGSGNNGGTSGTPIKQLSELMDQASIDLDYTGMAEFIPLKRESFTFHHSPLDPPPAIRRLSVDGDESRDYISQYAYLTLKSSDGYQVYVVRGSESRRGSGGDEDMTTGRSPGGRGSSPIKYEWQFEYVVGDKVKADGTKAGGGEKFLTPIQFSCSPGMLHPRQARKVTLLDMWKKGIRPRALASKLEPTSPRNQIRNLTSPPSSPTSPKGVGVGPLWLPSPSKLWGKRAKNSPYRLDKGSDGSEEELIPSEESTKRRKRRANSSCVPRLSRESEWPPQRWDGDRGQSADAVWQMNRDVRPATAGGGEESRGRGRAQSFGKGATSEGEPERMFTRPRGLSNTAPGYTRRPRTAR